MSRYDDDYDDNEDERRDDDIDDDEDDGGGIRRSTANPFSKPSSVRGAGLPQRPPLNADGSVPSPVRSPGAPGGGSGSSSLFPNRPGSGSPSPGGGSGSGGSGGRSESGVQPFNRSPLTRAPAGDDKKDNENDRSAAVNRVLGSFSQKLGNDDDDEDERDERGARPPASSNPFGTRLGGGDRPDVRRDEKSPGGSPFGSRTLGGSNDRQQDERGTSNPFGSRTLGGNDRSAERGQEDKSGIGGLTRGLGGTPSRLGGGNDKKDDKPASGSPLGGLTSRFGGGDKKDEKKDNKPGGSPLGGLTSRFGGGEAKKDDKKDNKPGGSPLGGLTSRFGGGDKKDEKKDNKPGGGLLGGGALGGLTSRFGGDKKDEKPAASAFGSNQPGRSSSPLGGGTPSPLGGALNRGGKPETSSTLGGAARSPFGGGAAPAKTGGAKKPAPSLSERLKGLNPFGKKDERPAARSRTSKAPRVEQGGLSLDNKLDIVGVTLLLGSLVLLLSSLSPTKGALTEALNHNLSYVFGWGAVFVLLVAFAIGVWLILRHFGDEAPVISRTRLIGLTMLFVGGLVAAQFIDSFQYKVGSDQDYLTIMKTVFLPIAYNLGRGGGWIGGEIYFQLISNFSEIGGFMVLIGWLLVGMMLALSLSASDLAIVVVSNARNFSDVMRQRRQRAAAQHAAKQQALAAAAQQISVLKPAEALAGAAPQQPALLPPSAEDQRRIPITTAGRTSTVPFRPPELADAALTPQPVPLAGVPLGHASGLFSRVRAALPGAKAADTTPKPAVTESAAAPAAGGLRARFLGAKAADKATAAPTTPSAFPQPTMPTPPVAAPLTAAAMSPAQTAAQAPVEPPAAEHPPRLRDLLGKAEQPTAAVAVSAATSGVQPFQRSALTRPEVTSSGERKPADSASSPMPDLQSRLQALRGDAKPAAPPLQSPPPTMPAEVGRAASPAFGKPADPPFAVPTRSSAASSADLTPPITRSRPPRNWKMPEPAGLLATGIDQETDHDMLLKRAHMIEETLLSFGAPGRVVDVRTGPVVTQFGVEPDYMPGRNGKKNRVKVGAIAALDKDLQLALGAKSIRIEAPVPGKGYVGIEVPNDKAEIVHLRDVLEAPEYKKIKSPLAIALGQGVDGTPVAADLASMPHLLIAGTTGSGKSVCVNAIIASLLLNNTPRTLKFIMVDPKRVELTQYNGIPHLVAPVVVELERIVSVLKWVTREMDERYRKFSNAAARNIEDYNKHLPATDEPMPYIVVIIDELADLMMLAPDDTERVITRIAALARATGIHLVIATQRPSVDVVTGLIKANFPARVAFAVAGNTDSRVILDQPGAERLLGRGDMLYMSGDAPAPVRLQGVWVSDAEIGQITRFWRSQMSEDDLIAASRPIGGSISPDDSTRSEGGGVIMRSSASSAAPARSQVAFWDADDEDGEGGDEEDDELADGEDVMYEQAVDLVRRLNKASVSLLQRRLRIGYTRAARLIDTMEERGIVGPAVEGSKPRDVLPIR